MEFVRRTLSSVKIPVCILPGNHDCFDSRSIYRRENFGANVRVFIESPTYVDFPELDLTIAGNPLSGRQDSLRVLRDIARRPPHRWFVAMAHGSLQIPGVAENTARPIHAQDIVATGADYVALGDWHGFSDYSRGAVKACYSGAPEPSASKQEGTGFIASVTLSDAGVEVEKVRVSAYPDGIPIRPEEELDALLSGGQIDEVIFAYSDVHFDYVDARRKTVEASLFNLDISLLSSGSSHT